MYMQINIFACRVRVTKKRKENTSLVFISISFRTKVSLDCKYGLLFKKSMHFFSKKEK